MSAKETNAGPTGAPSVTASSPLVQKILDGSAPRAIRLAAARGALPIPRAELFRLLNSLRVDPDDEISGEARKCMEGWGEEELQSLASDPGTDPGVLSYMLGRSGSGPALLAKVFSNPSTPLDSLLEATRSFSPETLDLLLLNQTLLLQSPVLLDQIQANPSAAPVHHARVEEIRRHFFSRPEPAPSAIPSADEAATDQIEPAPAASTEEGPADPVTGAQDSPLSPPGEETAEGEPGVREGTMQRIFKMNVGEKIQLASKGTREERTLLIRDSSRSVQDAVLNSPKISESEIEAIAKMRNVSDDILRQIAGHREWTKSYTVTHSLASNPKTPLAVALNFLPRLTTHDLKVLQTDKSVPEAVRRMARKHVEQRIQKPGSSARGGH